MQDGGPHMYLSTGMSCVAMLFFRYINWFKAERLSARLC